MATKAEEINAKSQAVKDAATEEENKVRMYTDGFEDAEDWEMWKALENLRNTTLSARDRKERYSRDFPLAA